MRKLCFSVILAGIILFITGCSNDESKNGNGINIPQDPPYVSGGSVTEGGDGSNYTVTNGNLYEFIDMFLSALDCYYQDYYLYSGKRAALPDEYRKGNYSGKGSYRIEGDAFGYAEYNKDESGDWKRTSKGEGKSGSGYEGESGTVKFFDFSNNNLLFLGGAVGFVEIWNETYEKDYNIEILTVKINGKIDFQGEYKGKVVFDNVEFYSKYRYDDNWDNGEEFDYGIKKGSFRVESKDGKTKVNLPDYLLEDFYYPYSNKDNYYGDGKISVKTPSVPAYPNGMLSVHSGNNAAVNAENMNMFFKAFIDEFYYGENAPRGYEYKENYEELNHGKESGYCSVKKNVIHQRNNSGGYTSITVIMEYNDYSNNGDLYFGGGYGKAKFEFYKYTNNPYSSIEKDTAIINGKVTFNGDFKGTLDFQNFKYVYEYNSDNYYYDQGYKHIGGSVKIGSLDVTQEYVKYVLKGERINAPQGNIDPAVVGT
ncbi:MAG: hypothetical protein LBH98_01305 [Chitinispirillales bacterium]|jgi:hypothetical protein|nr:hypothetical protein [Chitinispirillales bacterium]